MHIRPVPTKIVFHRASSWFQNFPIFQHEGIYDIYFYFLKIINAPYAGLAPTESRREVTVQYFFTQRKAQSCMWERLSSGVAEDTSAGSSQLWLCVSEGNEKIPVERNSWIWVAHLHTICILGGCWWLDMLDMLWLCVFWFPVICKRDPSEM